MLAAEYTTKHASLNLNTLYTFLKQYVGDKYFVRQIHII